MPPFSGASATRPPPPPRCPIPHGPDLGPNALAQQEHAGEAAAQAAAAFVQRPGDPAVRWHFGLACEQAGFAPSPLAAFINPGPWQDLARLASPATWQFAIIISALAGSIALG